MDIALVELVATWLAAASVAALSVLGVVVLPWSSNELRHSQDAMSAAAQGLHALVVGRGLSPALVTASPASPRSDPGPHRRGVRPQGMRSRATVPGLSLRGGELRVVHSRG